ncbi:discoidin domain-containing protein [Luteolibacter flavescens]|uniref:Discoidin domain-containing protein n=1 Tax=Luteolibacter flavescens TaxID=1859460 RepID=A0ABT3FQ35_9BACT|nr:discoidin domain-containing protein [Luteolibacter flavescens]MCW1885677.1 discoidin domain-containing protein [Luteolibacter flavescens]
MKTPYHIPALALLLLTSAQAGEASYSHFRFTPVGLRGGDNADSVQLAEFEFRFLGQALDMTTATVTNPDGDNPGNEGVDNVKDGDLGSKWLDFNKGALVFEFPEVVTIDQYRLGTAGDAEDRDPVTWTLEGSNDGDTWTLIDERTNYPVPYHRETYSANIHVPPFTNLELYFFRAADAVLINGASTNLSWEVLNATTLTIDPTPGAVAGSGSFNVTPAANSDTTYTLTAVQGEEEATQSVTIRTVAGGSASARYVRFTPVKLRDTSTANSIQICDFDFFLGTTRLTVASATAIDPDPSEWEGPENLLDNDPSTKWLDYSKNGLVFDFGAATTFDGYRFTTGNDYTDRDPVRWTLEGSPDGNTWTLIENMTAYDFPTPINRKQPLQTIPLPGTSLQPLMPLAITASAFDFVNSRVSLTFRSRENDNYRVTSSAELTDWSTQMLGGISGADGADTTTVEFNFIAEDKLFFRVEEE